MNSIGDDEVEETESGFKIAIVSFLLRSCLLLKIYLTRIL